MVGNRFEEGVIGLSVNLFDGSWSPIPGYGGTYFINREGVVCNLDKHFIKPIPSKAGMRVELRKNGQREKVLILDLLIAVGYNTYGDNESSVPRLLPQLQGEDG